MCYERYKGYSVCSHADPQSTPTESKLCDEFINTGVCVMGKKHVLVTSEYTPSLCPRCWELEVKLELSIGSLDDSQSGSDTWRLWCRLGWKHKDLILVVDLIYVVQMAQAEMHKWEGPRHNEQAFLKKWIEVFEGFKDWLWERLDKRDGEGRLYFPPGEEKGVRIEKKSVLRHLVSWMLINMARGKFNNLETIMFREGLEKAFNDLIYQWDTHFPEDPGSEPAKEEFTKYWMSWFGLRGGEARQVVRDTS